MKTKTNILSALALSLIAATPAAAENTKVATSAEEMEITRNGTQKSFIGPDKFFTGTAVVDRIFSPNKIRNTSAGFVSFAPGARSAWHTHPAGQTLVVTSGTGWIQEEGGKKREIKAGDVIWTPPGVRHWHGATDSTSMGHYAIQDFKDGDNVLWEEHVSDDQYMK